MLIERKQGAPIFVASGGVGASGEQLVRTVLAQFANVHVPMRIWPHIRQESQLLDLVSQAAAQGATIVHTLVNVDLRARLAQEAAARGVPSFDLVGDLMEHLSRSLGQEPMGQPGLYRELFATYFQRVEAIEYTVAHDDGKRLDDMAEANVVLAGVSRVGKTPLSMYLAMQGWKVANVPLVMEVPPPPELFTVDPRRVVGLMLQPHQLLIHRRWRQERIGIPAGSYVERERLNEELRAANHLFHKHGFAVVDATDKPLETTGEEVIAVVTRRIAGG